MENLCTTNIVEPDNIILLNNIFKKIYAANYYRSRIGETESIFVLFSILYPLLLNEISRFLDMNLYKQFQHDFGPILVRFGRRVTSFIAFSIFNSF